MPDKRGGDRTRSNSGVVVQIATAKRALDRKKGRDDPAPNVARGAAPPGQWTPNNLGLPVEDPCPVEPIGFEGSVFYMIDSSRQFVAYAAPWEPIPDDGLPRYPEGRP